MNDSGDQKHHPLGQEGRPTRPEGPARAGSERSRAEERRLEPPERSVIEGVRRRDRGALGAFFDHYFDAIYGLAYRFLGNVEQAQDATQEVFLRVHRGAPNLDPERDPAPWVMTIALNTCRSVVRTKSHRVAAQAVTVNGSIDYREELTDSAPTPDKERELGERERLVQEALGELPESLREIVLLRDYQGLTHKEAAEILQLGHDAARKRYSRALAELGARLRSKLG